MLQDFEDVGGSSVHMACSKHENAGTVMWVDMMKCMDIETRSGI